jgi:hypothetical protein
MVKHIRAESLIEFDLLDSIKPLKKPCEIFAGMNMTLCDFVTKILETERLILRLWKDSDIELMAAIDQDPKVCEYLPSIGNRTVTEAVIQRAIHHYEQYGFCLYAVELKSTHEFIGWVGLSIPSFMEKIGMQHNPVDDFEHPKLDVNHPLSRHVLYRISKV